MVQIKGHKKAKEKTRGEHPWPRKQIVKHTGGKCPYCHKNIKNIEKHIKSSHKFEKPKKFGGKVHGHD